MATAAQRIHLHALMELLMAHEPRVHYPPHDVRTAADLATFKLTEQQLDRLLATGGSIQADCSEMVTELCRWAGLADPNGLNYRYAGYTGTMLATLPHYDNPGSRGTPTTGRSRRSSSPRTGSSRQPARAPCSGSWSSAACRSSAFHWPGMPTSARSPPTRRPPAAAPTAASTSSSSAEAKEPLP
jgi:hypothetical protein